MFSARPSPHGSKLIMICHMQELQIGRALARQGKSQTWLAEAIGASRGHISALISSKKQPSMRTLEKIADALAISVGDLYASVTPISVAGRVGAGAEVDLMDAYEKGDGHYFVNCPPQLPPHGIVAVEVVGDSMMPIYEPGSVLFYSRDVVGVPAEAYGRICVCEDRDGKAWVKQVKPGATKKTFDLLSINPTGINMHDVSLRWAAPVRMHLQPDLVEMVDP